MSKDKLKEGHKDDAEKIRYDLISFVGLEELAKVYTIGAKKYEDNNWRKGIKWSRIIAAMLRHLTSYIRGETYDKESGLNHLAHVAWGCFALIEFNNTHKKFDDRFKDV